MLDPVLVLLEMYANTCEPKSHTSLANIQNNIENSWESVQRPEAPVATGKEREERSLVIPRN